ncbi:MAG TPA: NAD-dependent epimerase/dehydratase family protein [Solirubrobacterales bacterium]|jgi:nucleoside-diphosphate-sugar epimerase|nr:NAD-dependent epimerase/dehydratase family protein [Solirubrobacterales bacterium]
MRVVVTGASGNVGTSLLEALADEPQVSEVIGLARRIPSLKPPKVRWVAADVTSSELTPFFRGAAAAVHLAWAIQPSRDEATLERVNVFGSQRVFEAVAEAEVPALVHASSVGAYGPGPKDRRVKESWPVDGIATSFYSRHKSRVEALLDAFEETAPRTRVVRLRPGLIFKSEAASEIRRLFIGPLLPGVLVRSGLIPVVPKIERLRFQAVHSRDVGDAYRRAIVAPVRGAFNIAAEPAIGPGELGEFLHARPVPFPPRLLRRLADLTWRLRLQPSPPGWIDMALGVPLMDTARAGAELGWRPARSSLDALGDLLRGLRHADGISTPPLDPRSGGPGRLGELATGVGARR